MWPEGWNHFNERQMREKGLGQHNYCRNPSSGSTIWCYTTDPVKRWEYCDPIEK